MFRINPGSEKARQGLVTLRERMENDNDDPFENSDLEEEYDEF